MTSDHNDIMRLVRNQSQQLLAYVGVTLLLAASSCAADHPHQEDEPIERGVDVSVLSNSLTLSCQAGAENTNEACSDGISNDGDGYIDCNDFDCCGGGLSVCTCCGNGCGPVYPDTCSCSVACTDNTACAAGEYCWAASDCASSCVPIPTPQPAGSMKVMEYNVLGVDPHDPNPAWVDTIVAQDADIAVLVETDWDDIQSGTTTWCTYYYDKINTAMLGAGKAPYTDYHCARGITFSTLGTSILSRFPVLNATHVGELHPVAGYQDDSGSVTACDDATTDPFMDWQVQAPGGSTVHLISAHLKCCPGATEESRREKSQECINNYIDSLGAGAAVIYTGDLNSFSPADGDPSCFGQSGLGTGPLDILYSASDPRRTFNHTWTDAYRHGSPLQCGDSATYGITYPSFDSRIDFIEVNQNLAALLGPASVGSGAGSDHLPLSISIDMSGPVICTLDSQCDDGLFCNGAETCAGGSCQPGSDPCLGQSCDEASDSCFTTPASAPAFINELHYDNASADTGEFVEIAGAAGLNLSGYLLIGYNGNNGAAYKTVSLSGVIPDQGGCMGTLSFAFSGLQNGSPDGIALADDQGALLQFVSYEGTFSAVGGPADGMSSLDIGVAEDSSTQVGESLRLSGTGAAASDFDWQPPAAASPGAVNLGQTFNGCGCSVDADCDDGLYCNGGETCVAGSCLAGSPPSCDDGVSCTADSCNESVDSCDHIADSALCDNGLFCDGIETCSPVLDCQAGDDPCNGQSCDEAGDMCLAPPAATTWINELHYDNTGRDSGEFVEIAGPAGLDLLGYQLVGYNGNNGASYRAINLSGVIPAQSGCMGTLSFAFSGLQNGSPDGIALIDDQGAVLQFLSYEGTFTAVGGPADGMSAVDIAVAESSSTQVGQSLSLTGAGAGPADFNWQPPAQESPGATNPGQTLDGCAP